MAGIALPAKRTGEEVKCRYCPRICINAGGRAHHEKACARAQGLQQPPAPPVQRPPPVQQPPPAYLPTPIPRPPPVQRPLAFRPGTIFRDWAIAEHRQNIRINARASTEVFVATWNNYRTGQEILEKILQRLDMKDLLRTQRVSRTFRQLSNQHTHLQRRLWMVDTTPPKEDIYSKEWFKRHSLREDPEFVDPLIHRLRSELDIYIQYDVKNDMQKILYMPTAGHNYTLDLSPRASWRRMAAMRSAQRGLFWQVVIAGKGTVSLGYMENAPTFGLVIAVIVDAVRNGGSGIKLLLAQEKEKRDAKK